MSAGENGFGVEIRESEHGWQVTIVDAAGAVVSERPCRDHPEARILRLDRSPAHLLAFGGPVPQLLRHRRLGARDGRGALMGFNYQQPGKVKKVDLIIFGVAVVVIVALVLWAIL